MRAEGAEGLRHTLEIAAYSLALAGSLDQARAWGSTPQRVHHGIPHR